MEQPLASARPDPLERRAGINRPALSRRRGPRHSATALFLSSLVVALWALLLLEGCSRSKQPSAPAQPAAAAAPAPSAAAERQPAASIRTPPAPTPSTRVAGSDAATQTPPPATTPATSADLLQSSRGTPVAPRDFQIGRLETAAALGADEAGAAGVLARFLDGLVASVVPEGLYEEQSSERLERSIAYYLGKGLLPTRYRIGELKGGDVGESIVDVRLFTATGVAEGEVYLVRLDSGEWRISDVQVGFSLLAQPYLARTEPFVPSSYEYQGTSAGTDGE